MISGGFYWPFVRCLWLACLLLGLSACGGGSGGGGNSGQTPDPVVVDMPLAYVQRPVPVDEDGEPVFANVLEPAAFIPGAELFLKARPTAQAAVVNISRAAVVNHPDFTPEAPNYDVKDVTVSPDGRYIAFALREPDANPNDNNRPTWNIWEYDRANASLRRVIGADFEAQKGNDVSPRYLPNGRLLFSSDRQTRSREILLDEGRPPFSNTNERDRDIASFQLHSMRIDGSDIQQLSFNQSHSIAPSLLANGRVLFLRWDGFSANRISFYTMNPDGTQVERYFGYNSLNVENALQEDTARLFQPQPLPDGRIAAIYMYNQTQLGGDMVAINPAQPEGVIASIAGLPVDITPGNVSLHGRFASLSPLHDGTQRLLVSWSQCRLLELATATTAARLRPCQASLLLHGLPVDGYEEAPPLYGIWVYNLASQTQLPVVLAEDGRVFTEAIALENLAAPPAYIESQLDADLAPLGLGALHIRSVYDQDGTFNAMGSGAASLAQLAARPAAQRPARFVRFIKAVSVPDNDTLDQQPMTIYGRNNGLGGPGGLQEILGYAPVEADGSVLAVLPADVAFTLEVLDAQGRQISANINQWLNLRPGEIRHSNGLISYGREDLAAPALNSGAPGGASFANTQRYDALGAPVVPQTGQTMAEFAAASTYCWQEAAAQACNPLSRLGEAGNLRRVSVNIVFSDEWHEPQTDSAIDWNYSQLPSDAVTEVLLAPAVEACREPGTWTPNCRIVINYEYHIQPLWERERDSMVVAAQAATSCTGCHSGSDATGNTRVPLAQLALTRTPRAAANIRMKSYLQLLNGNERQVQYLYEGALVSLLPVCEFSDDYDFIPSCEVTRDEEGVPTCAGVADCPFEVANETTGELELDAEGNPIPRYEETDFLPPPMSRGGAQASSRFFNLFNAAGSHQGFLNDSELKLLYEWLDTNGQYYTNPFDTVMFE